MAMINDQAVRPKSSSRGLARVGTLTDQIQSLPAFKTVQRVLEPALFAVVAASVLAALWAAFFYAPTDALQGNVQRIEYIHVPIAWVAYLAFCCWRCKCLVSLAW